MRERIGRLTEMPARLERSRQILEEIRALRCERDGGAHLLLRRGQVIAQQIGPRQSELHLDDVHESPAIRARKMAQGLFGRAGVPLGVALAAKRTAEHVGAGRFGPIEPADAARPLPLDECAMRGEE